MPLLLHAISPAEALEPAPPGWHGAPLERIDGGGLSAWVTAVPEHVRPPGREDLLAAHAVVCALHAALSACVPARFPTWLADAASVRDVLATRGDELERSLARVGGRTELALTGVWTTPPTDVPGESPDPAPAGTRYLRARQRALAGAEHRRARAAELTQAFEAIAAAALVEAEHHLCPSPAIAFSSALLVPREAAAHLATRLPRREPDVRILVNGPWPPYTFATVVSGRHERRSGGAQA